MGQFLLSWILSCMRGVRAPKSTSSPFSHPHPPMSKAHLIKRTNHSMNYTFLSPETHFPGNFRRFYIFFEKEKTKEKKKKKKGRKKEKREKKEERKKKEPSLKTFGVTGVGKKSIQNFRMTQRGFKQKNFFFQFLKKKKFLEG